MLHLEIVGCHCLWCLFVFYAVCGVCLCLSAVRSDCVCFLLFVPFVFLFVWCLSVCSFFSTAFFCFSVFL